MITVARPEHSLSDSASLEATTSDDEDPRVLVLIHSFVISPDLHRGAPLRTTGTMVLT